jgi:4-alpha-glucanotransferase
MAVLQFAFGGNTASSLYAPHNHTARSVVYTGTHDNNTTRGWFSTDIKDKNRKQVCEYTGHFVSDLLCHEDFIRMAYGSVAAMAIIPVQDILGLDENARMNTPSTSGGNWDWKMKRSDLRRFPAEKLNQLAILFGRT